MSDGWIKIHRSILEDELYFSEKFTRTQAWIDLLLLAEYKPKVLFVRGIRLDLQRGQLAISIRDLSARWKWGVNKVQSFIKELVERINELYLDKGYITARAYLPEQTIENNRLKIAILEGKVGKVTVEGNRWTKEKHIKDRLNMKEGEVFNVQKLEENMLVYNRYNDNITIKGDLNRGQKNGTTDITIKAEEKAPYHIMAVADNAGRKTIGKNRAGLIAQHDSLFGYRDKL